MLGTGRSPKNPLGAAISSQTLPEIAFENPFGPPGLGPARISGEPADQAGLSTPLAACCIHAWGNTLALSLSTTSNDILEIAKQMVWDLLLPIGLCIYNKLRMNQWRAESLLS